MKDNPISIKSQRWFRRYPFLFFSLGAPAPLPRASSLSLWQLPTRRLAKVTPHERFFLKIYFFFIYYKILVGVMSVRLEWFRWWISSARFGVRTPHRLYFYFFIFNSPGGEEAKGAPSLAAVFSRPVSHLSRRRRERLGRSVSRLYCPTGDEPFILRSKATPFLTPRPLLGAVYPGGYS